MKADAKQSPTDGEDKVQANCTKRNLFSSNALDPAQCCGTSGECHQLDSTCHETGYASFHVTLLISPSEKKKKMLLNFHDLPPKAMGFGCGCHRNPHEIDHRMLGQQMDMAPNGNVALPVVSSILARQVVAVQSHAAKHLPTEAARRTAAIMKNLRNAQ